MKTLAKAVIVIGVVGLLLPLVIAFATSGVVLSFGALAPGLTLVVIGLCLLAYRANGYSH